MPFYFVLLSFQAAATALLRKPGKGKKTKEKGEKDAKDAKQNADAETAA